MFIKHLHGSPSFTSILLFSDRALERKRLEIGSLKELAFSRARTPALLPLSHLLCLRGMYHIPREIAKPLDLEECRISGGILSWRVQSVFLFSSHKVKYLKKSQSKKKKNEGLQFYNSVFFLSIFLHVNIVDPITLLWFCMLSVKWKGRGKGDLKDHILFSGISYESELHLLRPS